MTTRMPTACTICSRGLWPGWAGRPNRADWLPLPSTLRAIPSLTSLPLPSPRLALSRPSASSRMVSTPLHLCNSAVPWLARDFISNIIILMDLRILISNVLRDCVGKTATWTPWNRSPRNSEKSIYCISPRGVGDLVASTSSDLYTMRVRCYDDFELSS